MLGTFATKAPRLKVALRLLYGYSCFSVFVAKMLSEDFKLKSPALRDVPCDATEVKPGVVAGLKKIKKFIPGCLPALRHRVPSRFL